MKPLAPSLNSLALLALALLLPLASQTAAADEDAERENLARISYELERLQLDVKQAAAQAPAGARIQFRYDWLARDLQLMRDGIAQHLEAPRQPRAVPALAGDYRR